MPALKKRAGKRAHARKSAGNLVLGFAFDMEEPLNEAIDAARALLLMGHGLHDVAGEDDGRAVTAVAWTACQKLDEVQALWRGLWKAAKARAKDAA